MIGGATATRATTRTRTPSSSSATRSTCSRSATASTAARVRDWPGSRARRSSRRWPVVSSASSSARRSGCRATWCAASVSCRCSRSSRHEDRPRPPAVRGARPVRGGGAALMHLDDDGELVIDQEEFEAGSADEAAAAAPSASARSLPSGSNDVPRADRHRRQRHRRCHRGRHPSRGRLRRRDHARSVTRRIRPTAGRRCRRRCCATRRTSPATCFRRRCTARRSCSECGPSGSIARPDGGSRLGGAAVVRRPGHRDRVPATAIGGDGPPGADSSLCARIDDALRPARRIAARPRSSSSAVARLAWRSRPARWRPGATSPWSRSARPWVCSSAATSPGCSSMRRWLAACASFDWAPPASRVWGHDPVELADGSVLEADVVVTAIGDIPNVEWLAGSGLLRDGALIADERGQVAPGRRGRGRRRDGADAPRTAQGAAVELRDRAEQGRCRPPGRGGRGLGGIPSLLLDRPVRPLAEGGRTRAVPR